jgi:small subunit ribosomal protein S13
MIYLFESDLSDNKTVYISLSYIYGIGKKKSKFLCKSLGFSDNYLIKNLSKEQINRIIKFVESSNILIESDLKKKNLLILKNLISIKSYKGLRRYQGLPVRGQRTHTNGNTSKKIK